MQKVAIISCVSKKKKGSYPAKELYDSPLFKYAYKYAKKECDKIFIISAKYGLIGENDIISDYDLSVKQMKKRQKMIWADTVNKQIQAKITEPVVLQIHAGREYTEYLLYPLSGRYPIELILDGYMIGQRLQWYKKEVGGL
jgi:cytoplasmic iron level regulating protein YaaA (DUF328/UPF0246 family)